MELGEFLDLQPNEMWLREKRNYTLPEEIVFQDIKIYNERGLLEALANTLTFNRAHRGPRPMFTSKNHPSITTEFAGVIEGIEWLHCGGPQGAYYNGLGWWKPGMTLKWEDGEAMFKGDTYIGFLDGRDHKKYTTGSIAMKLYS